MNENETNNQENVVVNKNIFDWLADFFEKMTRGVFKFTWKMLKWLYLNFGKILKKILHYLRAMGRLIFWFTIWIFTMLLGFIAFAWQKFVNFWIWVWDKLVYFVENFIPFFTKYVWPFLKEHGGEIWLVIAAIGSLYGILYVTLIKRAKKRNQPFKGIFGWLKRSKKGGDLPDTSEKEN